MKESTFYQGILEEGEALGEIRAAKKMLLRQGRERFGPPSEQTVAAIQAIEDFDRLEQLSVRLLQVGSWAELLEDASNGQP